MSWRNFKVQLCTTLEKLNIKQIFVYIENDALIPLSGSIESLYFCEFSLVEYLSGKSAVFAVKSFLPTHFLSPTCTRTCVTSRNNMT